MTEGTRSRAAGAVVLALVAAAVVAALLHGLGGGTRDRAPEGGSARLVPADALLYVHISTDRGRPGVKRAAALARRFDSLSAVTDAATARLDSLAGGTDFERDIRPWLGREAAFALLNSRGSTAGSLVVAEVSDRTRARRFVATVAGASAQAASYRGSRLTVAGNLAFAFTGRYLVAGQAPGVRRALDLARGTPGALGAAPVFRRAVDGLPAGRALDVYASAEGIDRLLTAQRGLVGVLGGLLRTPGTAADGFSLDASAHGLRATIRQARAAGTPPPAEFEPRLAGSVPARSMAYIGLTRFDRAVGPLLAVTGPRGQALAQRLAAATAALRKDGGPALQKLAPLVRGEVALSLIAGIPAPTLTFVAPAPDAAGTSVALTQLAGALRGVRAIQTAVDGVRVTSLELSPGNVLHFALSGGRLVASTTLAGIRAVVREGPRLDRTAQFRATLGGRPKKVTSLVFLDFSQLLRLGERSGLSGSRTYLQVAQDLRKVRALGAATTSGENVSTTELRLQIP